MPVYAYQTTMCCTTSRPFYDRPDLEGELDDQIAIWMNEGLTDGLKNGEPRPDYDGTGMQLMVLRVWTTTEAAQTYINFVSSMMTANNLDQFDIHEINPIT